MNIDLEALRSLESEHGISYQESLEAIARQLLHTYYEFGEPRQEGEKARIDIDQTTGQVSIILTTYDDEGQVLSERDATPINFAVNGVRAVRHVIHSFISRSDRGRAFDQYAPLERTVVSGIVEADAWAQERGIIKVRIGSELDFVEGFLLPSEQIPGEKLAHGDRIKCFVVSVNATDKGLDIVLSRTHPELVHGLFALEVPEVARQDIDIVSIAREAGHRTKVAVRALRPGVRPKGSCIGPRGQRINNICSDLGGEKIDIIDWNEDPARYVANALAPAKVYKVEVLNLEAQEARVTVPQYQLSLAIGREGQNARLAARLTGWKIDIHSDDEANSATQA